MRDKVLGFLEGLELWILHRKYGDTLYSSWVGISDPPYTREDCSRVAQTHDVRFDGSAFIGKFENIVEIVEELAGGIRLGEESLGSIPIGVRDDGGWWYGGHHPNGYINKIGDDVYRWQVFEDRLTLRMAIFGLFRALLRFLKLPIPFMRFR